MDLVLDARAVLGFRRVRHSSVRQAYFLGGKDPYAKLKTALKAEIDEDAWSILYSKVSRPFDKPSKGKIAVKAINRFGDEAMKVYDVREARGA